MLSGGELNLLSRMRCVKSVQSSSDVDMNPFKESGAGMLYSGPFIGEEAVVTVKLIECERSLSKFKMFGVRLPCSGSSAPGVTCDSGNTSLLGSVECTLA